jgi:hypothetical protein
MFQGPNGVLGCWFLFNRLARLVLWRKEVIKCPTCLCLPDYIKKAMQEAHFLLANVKRQIASLLRKRDTRILYLLVSAQRIPGPKANLGLLLPALLMLHAAQ